MGARRRVTAAGRSRRARRRLRDLRTSRPRCHRRAVEPASEDGLHILVTHRPYCSGRMRLSRREVRDRPPIQDGFYTTDRLPDPGTTAPIGAIAEVVEADSRHPDESSEMSPAAGGPAQEGDIESIGTPRLSFLGV